MQVGPRFPVGERVGTRQQVQDERTGRGELVGSSRCPGRDEIRHRRGDQHSYIGRMQVLWGQDSALLQDGGGEQVEGVTVLVVGLTAGEGAGPPERIVGWLALAGLFRYVVV